MFRPGDTWVPAGVVHKSTRQIGKNPETGTDLYFLVFTTVSPVTGKSFSIDVVMDEEDSMAHVEDMVATGLQNFIEDERVKDYRPPTNDQKKELGLILEDIRVKRTKRGESSNKKIYYEGKK